MNLKHAGGQSLVILSLGVALVLMLAAELPLWGIFWVLVAVLAVVIGIAIAKGKFVGPDAYARAVTDDLRSRLERQSSNERGGTPEDHRPGSKIDPKDI